MLHIVATIYQSWPFFHLFISPSAFLQQPTLGLRWSLISAEEESIFKYLQGTGGLLKYVEIVSRTRKLSSDPAVCAETLFSTPNSFLFFLSFCGILTRSYTRPIKAFSLMPLQLPHSFSFQWLSEEISLAKPSLPWRLGSLKTALDQGPVPTLSVVAWAVYWLSRRA